MTETFNCLNCGKVCIVHSHHWQKKYCSKKCNDQHYSKLNPKVRQKAWRKYLDTHIEEQRERSREYYQKNREIILLKMKEYYIPNNARGRAKTIAKKYLGLKICSECKTLRDIDVHHIDFDPLNNNPKNLVYLCSICHGKKHQINYVR